MMAAALAAAVIGVILPDLQTKTLDGTSLKLSDALRDRTAVLVVIDERASAPPTPGWTLVRAPAAAKWLEGHAAAIVDSNRVVRAAARDLRSLSTVAAAWAQGREIYGAQCLRCHGSDGTDDHYPGIKPLRGIGKRLAGPEIIDRTIRSGNVDMTPLGQESRDALALFVASL